MLLSIALLGGLQRPHRVSHHDSVNVHTQGRQLLLCCLQLQESQ
jgi:hypothetical protein